MRTNETAHISSQQELIYPGHSGYYGNEFGGGYPGLDSMYGTGRPNMPVTYSQAPAAVGSANAGAGAGGGGGGGLLGSFNLGQVKGFVDKMGGIDGIVSTMTRVQKMVSSFQQMAPMLKLLMGSFGGAKTASSTRKSSYKRKRSASRTGKRRSSTKRRTASSKAYKAKRRR